VDTKVAAMMVHVPNVLAPEQIARCRTVMEQAAWVDGRVTAGPQSAKVKHNLQLPETAPEARELGDMVMEALGATFCSSRRCCRNRCFRRCSTATTPA
jgi:predicted 2-oxoglutarate/Fe(II)-dependent dioxygenase YbiX